MYKHIDRASSTNTDITCFCRTRLIQDWHTQVTQLSPGSKSSLWLCETESGQHETLSCGLEALSFPQWRRSVCTRSVCWRALEQAAKKKTFGTTGSRVVSQRGTRGCLTRLHFAIWNKMRCSTGSMTEPTAFPLFSGLCLHAALCSERDTSRERSENIRMNNFQCVSSLGSCISCGRLVKLLNSKYFL
ncbi:Hypothetical_protein [Hexamita inflata]|uniref:Hypothetical_protein n=1 Tax=Hexamita inflata TaxID=28002 RepID=A0AA86UML6_9EUKA|nr:Hypothetical protein HINF_LOCUS1575 [Hexamita inflata]CAI9952382.1 Hypothetical protein HINF_LOCUS40027 [Hexamita inflata]CAI9952386.1 Hypothetical protein HINF_LOCUS40031 [Hexamita inflata]CAI9964296.1 Hypothetical protein HINF_LOCUS51941 [Hexamita inflata]CAI9964298.1 Hypothetical protein HINF_LOCUS51943 [Hexamita inflata]